MRRSTDVVGLIGEARSHDGNVLLSCLCQTGRHFDGCLAEIVVEG